MPRGNPVANGVYLYTIRTRSSTGAERGDRPEKLFVLHELTPQGLGVRGSAIVSVEA